ncbi:MAG: hypothetical protein ACPGN3_17900 [Opitutales bacterium]
MLNLPFMMLYSCCAFVCRRLAGLPLPQVGVSIACLLAASSVLFGDVDLPREIFPYGFGGLDEMPVEDAVDLVMASGYSGIVPDVSARMQVDLDRLNAYLDRGELEGDAFSVYACYLNHKVFNEGYDDSFHRTVIDILASRGGGTLWMAVRAVRNPDTEITDYAAVDAFIKGVFEYATGEDDEGNYRNVNVVFYPHVSNAYESTVSALPLVEEINDPRFTVSVNLIHEYHAGLSDEASLENTFNAARGRIGAVILGGIQTEGDFSILSLEDSQFDLEPLLGIVRDSEYAGPVGFINFMIPEDSGDALPYPEEYLVGSMNEWESLTSTVGLYQAPPFVFSSSINPSETGLNLEWTSQMGKFYDVLSSVDMSVPIEDWEPYHDGVNTYSDIHTSGLGSNLVENLDYQGGGADFS